MGELVGRSDDELLEGVALLVLRRGSSGEPVAPGLHSRAAAESPGVRTSRRRPALAQAAESPGRLAGTSRRRSALPFRPADRRASGRPSRSANACGRAETVLPRPRGRGTPRAAVEGSDRSAHTWISSIPPAASRAREVDLVALGGPHVRDLEPPALQLDEDRRLQRVSQVGPPRCGRTRKSVPHRPDTPCADSPCAGVPTSIPSRRSARESSLPDTRATGAGCPWRWGGLATAAPRGTSRC